MWGVISFIIRASWETRCKSALSRTKTRLEVIKKKRNAMLKLLKEKIAHLLTNNLERDAYAKAEGLYAELTLSSCYDYVEQCCSLITEHVKQMHKQSECPEECKVAVASLIEATPSFVDLPDLRDLRLQFYNKYSISLESYANKEFLYKLKSKPPTIEVKLELLHDIAKESSIIWDPKSLEEQLQNTSMSTNDKDGEIDNKKDDQDNNENDEISPASLPNGSGTTTPENDMSSPTSSETTKRLKPSQSCVASSDDVGFGMLELPLPPGRRRYLSLSFSENDSNNNEKSVYSGKSKFVPPNLEEQKKTKGRHKRSVSYGNDGSFGLGNGKFPDIAELAERVAAHRKTQL